MKITLMMIIWNWKKRKKALNRFNINEWLIEIKITFATDLLKNVCKDTVKFDIKNKKFLTSYCCKKILNKK